MRFKFKGTVTQDADFYIDAPNKTEAILRASRQEFDEIDTNYDIGSHRIDPTHPILVTEENQ
jgi:hypothetical protein